MNKKSLLGLILFASLITTGLFVSAQFLVRQSGKADTDIDLANAVEIENSAEIERNTEDNSSGNNTEVIIDQQNTMQDNPAAGSTTVDILAEEPWLSTNPSDNGEEALTKDGINDTLSTSVGTFEGLQLIIDCNEVDYKAYIPEMKFDSELEAALDISNPSMEVDAGAAILFDAKTKEVLYYKNPVKAAFPASTVKLLTALVALNWCEEGEEVTIGDEITMIASDSTRAYLKEGQVLTIQNLLEAMLLPSGNDAAYAVAAYVGRKSLQEEEASKEQAVEEFTRLMNEEAGKLGGKNSCFKTPDGYDAIGQYTTAYDMGLIGVAAAKQDAITTVSQKSVGRNIFVSGEDVTWYSTNKLIKQYSGQYYSRAIGLKTGTSTMAGRCIVAAARSEDREVVCVILDSTSTGRWEDAIALLKYGLE